MTASKPRPTVRKPRPINNRGRKDHKLGLMTPRALRHGLKDGTVRLKGAPPPDPPPEWSPYRRSKLDMCITAAVLFMKGCGSAEIASKIGKPEVSRQCVSQHVERGVEFLLSRRWITRVDQKS